jgi:nucleoside-diphosphate-sugar epimerase
LACAGGVEYVFHVAAPYVLKPADPEAALMEPTVTGTKIILEYCQQTESVKKLIYTSCIQTLCNEFDDSLEYDETSWNETASLTRNSYAYSKTTAEREAWAFASRPDCTFKLVLGLLFAIKNVQS